MLCVPLQVRHPLSCLVLIINILRLPEISDLSVAAPQYDCITALRLLLCKETSPEAWKHLLLHKNHIEDRWRLHEEAVAREQQVVVGLLLEWAQLKHSGYTTEEVNMVSSLLATHSVKYQPAGGESEGRAMFPTFAFMSHSCDYNARHVVQPDGRMQVFAQRKISAGEEITITYTGLLTYQAAKQEKLANVWFFTCSCARCSDPTELGSYTSSVLCPGCPKRGYLLPGKVQVMEDTAAVTPPSTVTNGHQETKIETANDQEDDDYDDLDDLLDDLELNPAIFKKQEPEVAEPRIKDVTDSDDDAKSEDNKEEEFSFYKVPWTCNSCNSNIKGEQVSELLSKTKAGMFSVENDTISDHEKFLSASQAMLHPSNYQVIITKRILSQLYGRAEVADLKSPQLERKLSLCRELLDYVGRVDGGFSQFRGLTAFDYFQARRVQVERRDPQYR